MGKVWLFPAGTKCVCRCILHLHRPCVRACVRIYVCLSDEGGEGGLYVEAYVMSVCLSRLPFSMSEWLGTLLAVSLSLSVSETPLDTCQRPAAASAARGALPAWLEYLRGLGLSLGSVSLPPRYLAAPRGISLGRGEPWGGPLVIALLYRRRDPDMRTNHSQCNGLVGWLSLYEV